MLKYKPKYRTLFLKRLIIESNVIFSSVEFCAGWHSVNPRLPEVIKDIQPRDYKVYKDIGVYTAIE